MATKTLTYEYVSDYCVVIFRVEGEEEWSEEEFDSESEFDLADYVKTPEDFYLNDTYELDN